MTEDIASLPPRERLLRYRELEADALRLADRAPSEALKSGYLLLAEGWGALARDITRQYGLLEG